MKRLLLFLSISGFATVVIFLRAGAVLNRGTLPDFAWNRYWPALLQFLNHLAHGTFGYIYEAPPLAGGPPNVTPTRALVGERIAMALPTSLTLFLSALALGILLGLVGGLLASRFARPWVRRTAGATNLLFLSLPDLLVIFFLQWGMILLSARLGVNLLAPYGDWRGGLTLRTAILPILMLSLFPAAYLARISAAAFDNVFSTDYIRTARAKGVSAEKVTWGHALRNAVLPILAAVPTVSGIMISNLVIVEYAMNCVGLGWLMAWQVMVPNKPAVVVLYPSPNVIASAAICLAAMFVAIDSVVDLALLKLDPRTRSAREEAEAQLAAAVMDRLPLRERMADLWFMTVELIRSIRLPGRDAWRRLVRAYQGNLPLAVGTVIVGALILTAVLAPLLAPFGPNEAFSVITTPSGMVVPPFKPGEHGFLLGSDVLGRDILSRVIFGARYTLVIALLVVPLRMLIAVPLGLAAGFLRGRWESFVTWSATVLGAVPALMIQVLLMLTVFSPPIHGSVRQPNHPEPDPVAVLLLNCSILVLMGWPRMAESVRMMARELAARPFIDGARAVGASPARVMVRHILPHLGPTLAVSAAAEAAWVMMLLVHIGTFGVWLGGASAVERSKLIGAGLVSRFPDWSQMLDFPIKTLWYTPWALLVPAAAFVTAIFGFNLLAEGIRRNQQRVSA
ncbi:MAG TPA: ABC transporter permease subunit [Symbiobacteriaceae bacterium]|nr:ABC transporter permease subunit [Symbiobacteriaceae bacterium]